MALVRGKPINTPPSEYASSNIHICKKIKSQLVSYEYGHLHKLRHIQETS